MMALDSIEYMPEKLLTSCLLPSSCLLGSRCLLGSCLFCRGSGSLLGCSSRFSCLIVLQRCRHLLLQGCDTLGIRWVVAEDVTLVGTATTCHTLPERNRLLRVIACHGCENQAHIVCLCLIITRLLQVAERKILTSYCTCNITNTITNCLIELITQNIGTYLLVLLLGQLLCTMLSYSMSNLMT